MHGGEGGQCSTGGANSGRCKQGVEQRVRRGSKEYGDGAKSTGGGGGGAKSREGQRLGKKQRVERSKE